MKPVFWMTGVSVVGGLAATVLVGRENGVAVLLGMLGPLLAATISWVLSDRTFRRNPVRLTSVMIQAFMAKIVFFGLYVALMLRGLGLPVTAFMISFTTYFIALHFAQALLLRRLFTSGMHAVR
jgi:hypothetical protein